MSADLDLMSDEDVADRVCTRTGLLTECATHGSNFFCEEAGNVDEALAHAAVLLAQDHPLVARFRSRSSELERLIREFSDRYQHVCHACAESHF